MNKRAKAGSFVFHDMKRGSIINVEFYLNLHYQGLFTIHIMADYRMIGRYLAISDSQIDNLPKSILLLIPMSQKITLGRRISSSS